MASSVFPNRLIARYLIGLQATGAPQKKRISSTRDEAEASLEAEVDHHAAYRDALMRTPVLTADEEYALGKRWREDGDIGARDKLIVAHLKLVIAMATTYHRVMPLDELVSAGTLGLFRAAEAFDPDRGARFSTCARYWIKAALNKHLEENFSIVKARSGGKRLRDVSLNETLDRENEEGDTRQDQLTYEHENSDAGELMHLRECLNEVLKSALDAREQRIFEARRLADPPWTLEDLASEFEVSPARIRQIDMRAAIKVQKAAKRLPTIKRSKDELQRCLAEFYAEGQPWHHHLEDWLDRLSNRFPEATREDRLAGRCLADGMRRRVA